ncbi:hypothetical protein SLE2022_355350 [Rubroshorea leprosula]
MCTHHLPQLSVLPLISFTLAAFASQISFLSLIFFTVGLYPEPFLFLVELFCMFQAPLKLVSLLSLLFATLQIIPNPVSYSPLFFFAFRFTPVPVLFLAEFLYMLDTPPDLDFLMTLLFVTFKGRSNQDPFSPLIFCTFGLLLFLLSSSLFVFSQIHLTDSRFLHIYIQ